jgi:hypothetical protein
MQLSDDLIAELQRWIPYAVRQILPRAAALPSTDGRDRLYRGNDYQEEITQSMLLKILEDKGERFEKAFEISKKCFINLVMKASRNLTKDYLRNDKEVPFSQLDAYDGNHEDTSEDDYN